MKRQGYSRGDGGDVAVVGVYLSEMVKIILQSKVVTNRNLMRRFVGAPNKTVRGHLPRLPVK